MKYKKIENRLIMIGIMLGVISGCVRQLQYSKTLYVISVACIVIAYTVSDVSNPIYRSNKLHMIVSITGSILLFFSILYLFIISISSTMALSTFIIGCLLTLIALISRQLLS